MPNRLSSNKGVSPGSEEKFGQLDAEFVFILTFGHFFLSTNPVDFSTHCDTR